MGLGRKENVASAPDRNRPDGLSSLLDTERELTEQQAQADEEAAQIVAAARERIAGMERSSEEQLANELRVLDTAEESATRAALAGAAADGEARATRLDAVPEERIHELAEAVLRDFLGIAPLAADA